MINHQQGMDRIFRLADQFTESGKMKNGQRAPLKNSAQADEAISGRMDKLISTDKNDATPGDGFISCTEDEFYERKGLGLYKMDAQITGDSQSGTAFQNIGVIPSQPSKMMFTEFKPDQITHIRAKFIPEDEHQRVEMKAVRIDRGQGSESYQETLTWNMEYPKGIFED